MSRRRRKRNIEIPEVSLTPLIDTALTLLIIFMVTTPMLQDSIKVKLPEVKSRSERSGDFCLTVYIDENNKLYLNETEKDIKELKPEIEKSLKTAECKVIALKADKTIAYGRIMEIMDIINSAEGEKYVSLGTTWKP